MKKIICFDLDGTLTSHNNAYETMRLFTGGEKIFEVISRYDDLLVLEGRENYEPGDALKLIFPFLISHKICEKNLKMVSVQARLVPGAEQLISVLQKKGWKVYIISTSYEEHALSVAGRLGVGQKSVFCTKFPLDRFHELLISGRKEFNWVKPVFEAKKAIIEKLWQEDLSSGEKDKEIKAYLDEFFWEKIPKTELWPSFSSLRPLGGKRKVEALAEIIRREKVSSKEIAVVGDSITDFKMLRIVDAAGGLAIVFNGNEYALPYGTAGMAGCDLMGLKFLLDLWLKEGRKGLKKKIGKIGLKRKGIYYNWLSGKDRMELAVVLEIHRRFRRTVLESAAALG